MNAAPEEWGRFARSFAGFAGAATLALALFVLAFDPYGVRASSGRLPGPIMDINQRFMYPQIIRSGRYDSAIFGTSTVRLLDPIELGELFGARFANLGLNAGTPWEQLQLIELFLRHVPRPKVLILGLDTTWCEPDADRKRLTFRAFPPWLYDERRLNDLPHLLSARSLEIAFRVLLHEAGLMEERIRADGYEIFVPPESAYDLERARAHIRTMAQYVPGPSSAVAFTEAERRALPMPALGWLERLLERSPASATLLAFMPIHAAAQAQPGSRFAIEDTECKARIAAMAARHHATVIDFRRPSSVTTDDSNYWDGLHYRIGVARRIAADLWRAFARGEEAPDGFYRILARTPPHRPS